MSRPTYGNLKTSDGTTRAIMFRTAGVNEFDAIDPRTDNLLRMDDGDYLDIDLLTIGQVVNVIINGEATSLRVGGNHPVYSRPSQPRTKGAHVMNDPERKSDTPPLKNTKPWQGLATLAGLVAIIVLGIRGVVWALG